MAKPTTSDRSMRYVLKTFLMTSESPRVRAPALHDRTASTTLMTTPPAPAITHPGSGWFTPLGESLAVNKKNSPEAINVTVMSQFVWAKVDRVW